MVASGSVTIATEALGLPQRGTVLLAMGATATGLWWPDAFCQSLASAGYRVIRFDHRDTGASTTNPPGPPDYDLADMLGDLLAILDAYNVRSAHLVGMSLGGFLAQMAAISHPDRVLSLTLIASEPVGGTDYQSRGSSPDFMAHFSTMEALNWSDHAAVRDFLLGIARLSAGSAHEFDAAAALARIDAEIGNSDSIASAFNHARLASNGAEGLTVAAIRQPALIIHGTKDPVIPVAAGKALAANIPNARLLLLEGTGHELAAPDLPQMTEAILALLRDSEAATPL